MKRQNGMLRFSRVSRVSRMIRAGGMALAISLLLSVCGFYGTCQGVRDSVVRLHLLANSDSPEDQALKLTVRDAVIADSAGWLDGAGDAEEALLLAHGSLPHIRELAQQTVRDAGYDYPVKAQVCRTYFTTRSYGSVTLPAGMYDAVQITIGEGAGHNWWCVVFPPLCLGSATDGEKLSDVLTGAQTDLVTSAGRYQIRFRVVEWAERFLHWIKK